MTTEEKIEWLTNRGGVEILKGLSDGVEESSWRVVFWLTPRLWTHFDGDTLSGVLDEAIETVKQYSLRGYYNMEIEGSE